MDSTIYDAILGSVHPFLKTSFAAQLEGGMNHRFFKI